MYKHICKKCGKNFENYKKNSYFCSVNCRASYQHDEFLIKSKKLKGKRFGKLTVIDTKIEKQHTQCLCLCDCGNKIWVNSSNLKSGHSTSCGCYQKETALNKNGRYLEQYRKENLVENTNLGKLNFSMQKNNNSGVRGVHWHSQSKKWTAKLNFQGKVYRKEFNKIEDAIKCRKEWEEKYFKPILDKYNTGIYRKSIDVLIKQSKYITHKEWNKIATKENLLSAKTIEFISQKKLVEIIKENENKAD